jgi:hypothetical protein
MIPAIELAFVRLSARRNPCQMFTALPRGLGIVATVVFSLLLPLAEVKAADGAAGPELASLVVRAADSSDPSKRIHVVYRR